MNSFWIYGCVLVLVVRRVNDSTESADNAFLGHDAQEVSLEDKQRNEDM